MLLTYLDDPPEAESTKQLLQKQTPEMEAKLRDIEKQYTNAPAKMLLESRGKHLQKATEASAKYHPFAQKRITRKPKAAEASP